MAKNNLEKIVASNSFEYGNHTILLTVKFVHTYIHRPDYGIGKTNSYYRVVSARGYPTEDIKSIDSLREFLSKSPDVKNVTTARLRPEHIEQRTLFDIWPFCYLETLTSERYDNGATVRLPTQIEETAREALEILDEQYRVLDEDIQLDIEVSVERMKAEVSWVEVEDDMDRLSQEIDNLTTEEITKN